MNNVNVKMMYKCECNAIQQSTHLTHNVITWQSESKLSGHKGSCVLQDFV